MSDITFVRVRDESGNEFSQSTQTPLQRGCKVLDKPATDEGGNPLPWKPKVNLPSADVTALKGEALEARLIELGLPTTGKADEKRQRIADHEAAQLAAEGQIITNDDEENPS